MKKQTAALLIFILCAPGMCPVSAAETKDSANEEMLKRRQMVQLKTYFIGDPKKAKLPTTPMGVELFNQAVKYYEKGEYDLARKSLDESIKIDPNNSFAYELLGDVYNNQQDLGAARVAYEMAYKIQPGSSLKMKIEKLAGETAIDKKLATYKEEHFLIKYHDENKSMEGFELRELLRKTYRNISQDFGYYFRSKVVVLLYDEAEFKQMTGIPHWAGGIYDGKVRMPVSKTGFTEDTLKATTAHEVTHAFVAAMSNMRAPAWLNEGLAQYEENKIKPIDMIIFDSAVKTKTLLPLDQLIDQGSLQGKVDSLWVGLFYQQSLHLTGYLVKRYGMFTVKKMLTEFGKNKNSDEVIESVLQISVPKLEKEWRATFSK